jgi:hypothetical protein
VFRDATQHALFDMQAVRPVSTTFLLFTSAGAGHWRGSTGETRPSGVWTADLDKLGLVEWMGVDVSQMVGIDVVWINADQWHCSALLPGQFFFERGILRQAD